MQLNLNPFFQAKIQAKVQAKIVYIVSDPQGVGSKATVPLTQEAYKTRPSDLIRLWMDLGDLASRLEADLCDDVILKGGFHLGRPH